MRRPANDSDRRNSPSYKALEAVMDKLVARTTAFVDALGDPLDALPGGEVAKHLSNAHRVGVLLAAAKEIAERDPFAARAFSLFVATATAAIAQNEPEEGTH